MKKIFYLILSFITTLPAMADDSSWKLHPIFDEEVVHVVETPQYVYFTSRNLMEGTSHETYMSLFRYDKKGEELMPLSTSNILNSTSVRNILYNPAKAYLAVLYKDYTIDFLYDNGKVVTIPYYQQSNITYPKNVNSWVIDNDNDRIYIATDFGYIAVNDKKYEIAESRIYGEPLKAYCRLGDNFLAIKGDDLIIAPADDPRLSLDQYKTVETFDNPTALYPLNDSQCILVLGEQNPKRIIKLTKNGDSFDQTEVYTGAVYNIGLNSQGLLVPSGGTLFQFRPDGSLQSTGRPQGYHSSAIGSNNLSELWVGLKRKGLTSLKKSGENWSVTRDWMRPNSPATFASTSYLNHPSYGFLMLDYGYINPTLSLNSHSPLQLSGLKQGRWTNYGPAYTNPARTNIMQASNGMVMDPDNPNYIYISSYHDGIVRLNLSNPNDIIHMGRSGVADSAFDDYVVLGPAQNDLRGYWNLTPPYFDKQGNLWIAYPNYNDRENPHPHFYCWLAADRKATTSAKDIRLPELVEFDLYFPLSNNHQSLPLLKTGTGLIVYTAGIYSDRIALLDTNGTPTDTKDDKTYNFERFIDSDGNELEIRNIRYIWEDPSTGYVWICHANGVCYFVPSQVRQGNYQLYRLKVARNDGTNLADYLLDGVSVNHLAADSEGRKWFATGGGGVICTSSDGREILEEFTTLNSPLPNDVVYGIGFNSEANSLMFSTAQGYAEYSLPVSSNSSTKEDVRAYPNPVRPEYSGYVTITDIPQGSFVKIADAGGNLVKELGVMSGFEMLWDLSDSNFNRVKSGVYYILISPSDETSKYSTVGKILVVS